MNMIFKKFPAAALIDGFGAAAGDEVMEVLARMNTAEWTARRWRVGAAHGRLEAVS